MTHKELAVVEARAALAKARAKAELCRWSLGRAGEDFTRGVVSEPALKHFECDAFCADQDVAAAEARLAFAEGGAS